MVQYSTELDTAFAAVSDGTRRGILERLGRADASISQLAESFDMTLTGMKKHVAVLESARLVTTQKVGRVRTCRLGPRRLEREARWIVQFQKMMDDRFNRLEALLEQTQEDA
jgi:DNA-binding transcriptional ArsR family regulator